MVAPTAPGAEVEVAIKWPEQTLQAFASMLFEMKWKIDMESLKYISRRLFLQMAAVSAGGGSLFKASPRQWATLPIVEVGEREIFLLSTHIAGTTHVDEIDELEPSLAIEERLDLFRESNNPFDERAIVVKNRDGEKLGYIPRANNEVFSRLMDGGKMLHARVSRKETYGTWHRIGIKIYLNE